jgi:hypothetical protein
MAGNWLSSSQRSIILAAIGVGSLAVLFTIGTGPAREEASRHARSCIELNGESARCDKVNRNYLSPELANAFDKAIDRREKLLDARETKREQEKARRDAEQARIAAAKEARFKAEGWWEAENGIFIRWCTNQNPCPNTQSISDYTWRAMVWCRDRACGDIYARMNILRGETVVGWTNDTAYGDIGQKVVLTFGSYTKGEGRIVEFNARG